MLPHQHAPPAARAEHEPRIAERVARAVRRVAGHRDEVTTELAKALAAEVSDLPQDEEMLGLLAASVDESVAGGMYVLEHGVDPHGLGAPESAVLYARRLAQRGLPLSAMLRAYRLGSSAFIETMLAEIAADPEADTADVAAASVVVLRTTTAYVDTISELLVTAYEEEREAWSQHHSMARASRISSLLEGRDLDIDATEAALGYRLRRTHLAALLWFDERDHDVNLRALERVATAAAAVYGGQHLLAPLDEASATLWLTVPDEVEDLAPLIAALVGTRAPLPRVALGRPGFGAAGFRSSHRQALAARQVAALAGRHAAPVTTYAEVGTVALLCGDLAATRVWVSDILGRLADDDENAERLRETVRVYLRLGASHTAAAEALNLHKNSVQYRVGKAEALRGRPFRGDRADVELALRVAHALGAAVLTSARGFHPGDPPR